MDQNTMVSCKEDCIQEQKQQHRSYRNPVIEFARFIFSIMIIFWHGRSLFGGGNPSFCGKTGYIGVEFFFLVTGYLIAAKAWNQRDKS